MAKMLTTTGLLDPPLGNTRLQVSRLFATLFAIDDADLHICLIENDVVNKLLVRVTLKCLFECLL